MQQCRRVGGLLDLFAEQRHASLDGCDSHSGRPHSAVVLQQQRNLGQTVTRQGVMKRRTQHDSHPEKKPQQGMTLIEVLIAMLVMTVGMGGLLALFMTAATSTNRNSKDTSATLLAQMVLEQISAQHPDSTATINLTDCAGNAWTVATVQALPAQSVRLMVAVESGCCALICSSTICASSVALVSLLFRFVDVAAVINRAKRPPMPTVITSMAIRTSINVIPCWGFFSGWESCCVRRFITPCRVTVWPKFRCCCSTTAECGRLE